MEALGVGCGGACDWFSMSRRASISSWSSSRMGEGIETRGSSIQVLFTLSWGRFWPVGLFGC